MPTPGLRIGASPISNSGVFSDRIYEAGETIHMMDGRRLPTWRCAAEIAIFKIAMDDPLQIGTHTYLDLDELSIRFNHSCNANAAIRGERELFALRPIEPGEEITFDYALTVRPAFYTANWRMPCHCGAQTCRGTVGDIWSVPAGKRQAMLERGALQDYMVHWLFRSSWNWHTFRPMPPPPLPGKDHSVFLPGGTTGILLLHGLSGTPLEMLDVGQALAAQGHTVHCPQLAGHCGTYEDLKRVRWQDWAASAEAGLQRLRQTCDTVIIGGLSTGAILALSLAARFPEQIQGVAALAPTLWLNGWMVPYHAYLFRIVLQKPIANQFDFPDLPPHGIKDEQIRRRLKDAIDSGDSSIAGLPITPGGAVLEHRWLVHATQRDMPWIKQPVLIIAARDDDYAAPNNVADIVRRVGGRVETLTLDDSYHIITVDRQRHLVKARLAAFASQVTAEQSAIRDSRLVQGVRSAPGVSGARSVHDPAPLVTVPDI